MVVSMVSSLLFATLAATVQSCPAAASCAIGPEASTSMDPDTTASLHLVQVGLSLQSRDVAKEHTAAIQMKHVDHLLQEDVRELTQLLQQEVYAPTEPSREPSRVMPGHKKVALANATSVAIDKVTGQSRFGTSFSAPLIVTVIILVALGLGMFLLMGGTTPEVAKVPDDGADEVWHKRSTGQSGRLLDLFAELDEMNQSADSPPGMITRRDLESNYATGRIGNEFKHLGITLQDASTVFTLLDRTGNGFVTFEEFVEGCVEMSSRHTRVSMMM